MKTYRTFPFPLEIIDQDTITFTGTVYTVQRVEILEEVPSNYQRLQVLLTAYGKDYMLELNIQFDASSEDRSIAYFFAEIEKNGSHNGPADEKVTDYSIKRKIEIQAP